MFPPRLASTLEPLEARIAPAAVTLLNPRTATYVEADGDVITIKVSRGSLGEENFRVEDFGDERLSIFLNPFNDTREFAGADLRVTVARGADGNGLADLGEIDAGDLPLDVISIDGGAAFVTLKSARVLEVESLGVTGDSYNSSVSGSLGRLEIHGNLQECSFSVDRNLGSAVIGGSMIGGHGAGSGSLLVLGSVGSVAVGHSVIGGDGLSSGIINAYGPVGSVRIGDSVIGSSGDRSGQIDLGRSAGSITIGGSVRGGAGSASGIISLGLGSVGSIAIGGDLFGGEGDFSGYVGLEFSRVGSLTVGGSIAGGGGIFSGYVSAARIDGVFAIGGHLAGGDGTKSGSLFLERVNRLVVDLNVIGGFGLASGSIDLQGNEPERSRSGSVQIGGDVLGGEGRGSGNIYGPEHLDSLVIGGDLVGYTTTNTGIIYSQSIGRLVIGGDIRGGDAVFTGGIVNQDENSANDVIQNLSIGGSIRGGAFTSTGFISVEGSIGSLRIDGDVIGGSLAAGGTTFFNSGAIEAARMGNVFIGGSLQAGVDDSALGTLGGNGSIMARQTLGAVRIDGGLKGSVGANGDVTFAMISAVGQGRAAAGSTRDVAISSVEIGGSVNLARILGGYSYDVAFNADAQIGHVTVYGDWIGSELLVGAVPVAGKGSGYQVIDQAGKDDPRVISTLGEILIKGRVLASEAASEVRSGFAAQQIISFRSDGRSLPLTSRTDGPFLFGPSGSFGRLEEV